MLRSEIDNSGERLKAEIAEQTRTIIREMLAEFKREEREEKQEQLREERQERQNIAAAPPLP